MRLGMQGNLDQKLTWNKKCLEFNFREVLFSAKKTFQNFLRPTRLGVPSGLWSKRCIKKCSQSLIVCVGGCVKCKKCQIPRKHGYPPIHTLIFWTPPQKPIARTPVKCPNWESFIYCQGPLHQTDKYFINSMELSAVLFINRNLSVRKLTSKSNPFIKYITNCRV